MEIRKSHLAVIVAALISGSFLGAMVAYAGFDARLDSIDVESEPVLVEKSANFTRFKTVFENSRESIVSVTSEATRTQGSGFVYGEDGYIVTNEHVVGNSSDVEVTFPEGSPLDAEIVGTSPNNDLAVLRVERRGLDPLELAEVSSVSVGDPVVAIGNPFGLRGTMTKGIVSQKGRLLPTQTGFSIPQVIQTDAAINPGNSGGPLLNAEGEIVGVNTAIESRTGTFSGIGFAIPSSIVKNVVPQMIETGDDFRYPWLGVSGLSDFPERAQQMNLSSDEGFLVLETVKDSPAEKAGIRPSNQTYQLDGRSTRYGGDVVVGLGGEPVSGINDIQLYLQTQAEVGEKINVTVLRDGERRDIPLVLGSRSEANLNTVE